LKENILKGLKGAVVCGFLMLVRFIIILVPSFLVIVKPFVII